MKYPQPYEDGTRKFRLFITTVIIVTLLSGACGILHDELTYYISPEYYTRYKFPQLGYSLSLLEEDWKNVAIIGFSASWWAGLVIGILIGAMAYIYTNYDNMRTSIFVAVTIVFTVTLFSSLLGYFWGLFFLQHKEVGWALPEDLLDRGSYIVAGSMHRFSYPGPAAGLVMAILYMIRNKAILVRRSHQENPIKLPPQDLPVDEN
jgi:MFS family permease